MDLELLGYDFVDVIYESSKTKVVRAKSKQDGEIVVLKISVDESIDDFKLKALVEQEFSIISKLSGLEGKIAKSLGVKDFENKTVLLLEDGGVSLQDYVDNKGPIDVSLFLQMALSITEILGDIHQHQIIHKDIKPSNIVFEESKNKIRIIDFNISSLLSRENESITNSKILQGSLFYLSPEQTGRMNRSIDYRSDFYSLGITFYFLLTGELPFNSEDPLEIVHAHIAKPIPQVHLVKSSIPQIISKIIQKLCEKNAEKRYQTSYGLIDDLKKVQEKLNENKGNNFDFPLGENDISNVFQIPQKLFGREVALQQLMDDFQFISEGNKKHLIVKGPSGIGKTALVNEVHRPMVEKHGLFMSGKFEQFKRDIPYSALSQAFIELSGQLLAFTEEKLIEIKKQIKDELGIYGRVITDFQPELITVVGEQPPVEELPPAESMNRFNMMVLKFFKVIASKEHPLVMFIDDWQWADGASLKLLEVLLKSDSLKHFLIITSFRDNEVSFSHPLAMVLDQLEKLEIYPSTISVTPLVQNDIKQMLDEMFVSKNQDINELKDEVFSKTGGNPFFVGEILKRFYQENLINFDMKQGGWNWDLAKIKNLNISDNVVDLMLDKLKTLPNETQLYISLASCLGTKVKLKTLSVVADKSPKEIALGFWPALKEGLVYPIGEDYKVIQGNLLKNIYENIAEEEFLNLNIVYKFVHDRVQQASYELINVDEKKKVHLKTARLLKKSYKSEDELKKNIFELVNHYNKSIDLITSTDELMSICKFNLIAGIKAQKSAAFSPALKYIQTGMSLLPENHWNLMYDLSLDFYKLRIDGESLNGNFEECKKYADEAIKYIKSDYDKVEIYCSIVQMYSTLGQNERAVEEALKGYRILGVKESKNAGRIRFFIVLLSTMAKLAFFNFNKLGRMKENENEKYKVFEKLMTTSGPSFYLYNLELIMIIILRYFPKIKKYGVSPQTSFLFMGYSAIQQIFFVRFEKFKEWEGVIEELFARYNNEIVLSRAMLIRSYLTYTVHDNVETALEKADRGIVAGLNGGDFVYAAYNHASSVITYSQIGQDLNKVYERANVAFKFGRESRVKNMEDLALSGVKFCEALLGKTKSLSTYDSDNFSEDDFYFQFKKEHNASLYAMASTPRIMKSYLSGNYDECLKFFKEVQIDYVLLELGTFNCFTKQMFIALASSHLYNSQKLSLKERIIARFRFFIYPLYLKFYVNYNPSNFSAIYYLIKVAKYYALKKYKKVDSILEKASTWATQENQLNYLGIIEELWGNAYLKRGDLKTGQDHLRRSYTAFKSYKAIAKCKLMEKDYLGILTSSATSNVKNIDSSKSDTLSGEATFNSLTMNSKTTSGDSKSNFLDLNAALQSSQIIAAEIKLDGILTKTVEILRKNAGAERVIYLRCDENNSKLKLFILLATSRGGDKEGENQLYQNLPFEEYSNIAHSIVNYVATGKKEVVSDDITKDSRFIHDDYIKAFKPLSVLSVPVVHQGKMVGILYLENNLVSGAFTEDRLQLLRIVSGQMAVSIENAILYENLEEKVKERTRELKEAQKKLLEVAHKSGMADIASGILHNIGNLMPGLTLSINGLNSLKIGPKMKMLKNFDDILGDVASKGNFNEFVNNDEKGKKFLAGHKKLSEVLFDNSEQMDVFLSKLGSDFDKLKVIVKNQKQYTHTEVIKTNITLMQIKEFIIDECKNICPNSKIVPEIIINNPTNIDLEKETIEIEKHKYDFAMTSVFTNSFESMINRYGEINEQNGAFLKVKLEITPDEFTTEISDSGVGVEASFIDKVFSSGSTTKKNAGGMGLHDSYNFIYSMQGKMALTSGGVNQGATVSIKIPRKS